jgi:hypothetical protein
MRRNLVNVNYGRFGPPTNQFQQSNQFSQIGQIQSVYQVNPVLSNVINTQPFFYSAPPLSRPPFPSLSFASQFQALHQPQQLQPQTYYSMPPNMPPQPPQPLQSFMQPQISIAPQQFLNNNWAMPVPMPIQQVEETRVIQSINQNPNGTSDYITIPKSMFDQILAEKHFNEVPANCDLKYSLTQNNHGQANYNFHVIQRPEIRIDSPQTYQLQQQNSPLYFIPENGRYNLGNPATIAGATPQSEIKAREASLYKIVPRRLFGDELIPLNR